MIATRFRSVYWVGGVAVAALSCYLVSQRVAAERQTLAHVESDILAGKREIRALQTEIGTRAGLHQIERWNTEVISLTAPKPSQYLASEVQLASLVQPVAPAMDKPAAVIEASAEAPAERVPQITRASYDPAPARAEEPRAVAPVRIRAEVKKAHADDAATRKAGGKKDEPKSAKQDSKQARKHAEPPLRMAKADAPKPGKAEKSARAERVAKDRKDQPLLRLAKADAKVRLIRADGDDAPRLRQAVFVKPGRDRQTVALLDDKLLGSINRIAARERTKRDR